MGEFPYLNLDLTRIVWFWLGLFNLIADENNIQSIKFLNLANCLTYLHGISNVLLLAEAAFYQKNRDRINCQIFMKFSFFFLSLFFSLPSAVFHPLHSLMVNFWLSWNPWRTRQRSSTITVWKRTWTWTW